jgi:FkbM family methyltransferase
METSDFEKIIRAFKDKKIPKEQYWKELLEFHKILEAYADLIHPNELRKIEVTDSGLFIVLPNGLRFAWHPQDFRTAVSHIVNDGGYELKERDLLFRLVANAQTVFDIGANVGWYALHFSRLIAEKGGSVYAFEPIKKTYDALAENIDINKTQNISIFNNGFGDENRSVRFFLPECSGSVAASMRPLYDSGSEEEECEILKLDDFVAEREIKDISFLKCDVEGAELLVIRGGMSTLENQNPIVFMEMLRKWSARFGYHPNETIQLLADIGYKCFFNSSGLLVPMESMTDDCLETNFYFLNEEKHSHLIGELSR